MASAGHQVNPKFKLLTFNYETICASQGIDILKYIPDWI